MEYKKLYIFNKNYAKAIIIVHFLVTKYSLLYINVPHAICCKIPCRIKVSTCDLGR